MILVDTNFALRLIEPSHPHHIAAVYTSEYLRRKGDERLVIAPQSFYEMYVVMTRPTKVQGFGLDAGRASEAVERLEKIFKRLSETANVFAIWKSLVSRYRVEGKRAHDVRLVAMMIEYKIETMLTFNDADFKQFTEIKTINPKDLLGHN